MMRVMDTSRVAALDRVLVLCKFVTSVHRLRRVVVSLRDVSEIIFLDHVSCQFDRSLRDHDHGVVTQHVVTRECEFVMVTHVMGYSSCEIS
jgi:hypothetical protein